jgi:hypothetical protein
MTTLTAMEIAGNHPDNLLVESRKNSEDMHACYLYLIRDGNIHKMMLSSEYVFETAKNATDYMDQTIEKVVAKFLEDVKPKEKLIPNPKREDPKPDDEPYKEEYL